MVSYGSDVFARDVAAFMDALGLDRAVIVGHSMGSTVAQRFAIDYPERDAGARAGRRVPAASGQRRVRKFLDGGVRRSRIRSIPDFVREFQQSTLAQPVPPEFFETVVGESLKVPARVWKAALQPYLTMDFAAELTKIRVPTLLVWGDRDAFTGRAEQDALTEAIKTVTARVYVGRRPQPALGGAAALRRTDGVVRRGASARVRGALHRRLFRR